MGHSDIRWLNVCSKLLQKSIGKTQHAVVDQLHSLHILKFIGNIYFRIVTMSETRSHQGDNPRRCSTAYSKAACEKMPVLNAKPAAVKVTSSSHNSNACSKVVPCRFIPASQLNGRAAARKAEGPGFNSQLWLANTFHHKMVVHCTPNFHGKLVDDWRGFTT